MVKRVWITAELIVYWLLDTAVTDVWINPSTPVIPQALTFYTSPFPSFQSPDD